MKRASINELNAVSVVRAVCDEIMTVPRTVLSLSVLILVCTYSRTDPGRTERHLSHTCVSFPVPG